jgi:hypothetical protein
MSLGDFFATPETAALTLVTVYLWYRLLRGRL